MESPILEGFKRRVDVAPGVNAGVMLGLMNSQVFSNLNDSVLTQPVSLIVHHKEATVYVQKVKVSLPAFPPDSSCII